MSLEATRALLNYNVFERKKNQTTILHFKNKDTKTEPKFRLSFGTSKFQQPCIFYLLTGDFAFLC